MKGCGRKHEGVWSEAQRGVAGSVMGCGLLHNLLLHCHRTMLKMIQSSKTGANDPRGGPRGHITGTGRRTQSTPLNLVSLLTAAVSQGVRYEGEGVAGGGACEEV